MKKKIFSVLGILILGLNTVFCQAVEISFEMLDSQYGELIIDDKYSQESSHETENLSNDENIFEDEENIFIFNDTNFQESPIEATENNYEDKIISRINLLNSKEEVVENLSIPENLDYTTVDITDVFTGDIITHDCNLYLVTNFDETEHWSECSICGKVINLEEHNYQDAGWTGGSASNCSEYNMHQFICSCGAEYSNTTGRSGHNIFRQTNLDMYVSYPRCRNCEWGGERCYCTKSNGTRISCSNPGTCAICGTYYSAQHVRASISGTGDIYCSSCSKYMGCVTVYDAERTNFQNKFKSQISINGSYSSLTYGKWSSSSLIVDSKTTSGLSSTSTVYYSSHYEYPGGIQHSYRYYQGGVWNMIQIYFAYYPDVEAPIINDISSANTEEWSTDATISITGTENYCNTVNLTLKDMEGNVYLENVKTPVTNNTWNYEINPILEAAENTEFILQVTDTLGNVTEQSFYISKVDAIPPKAIENDELNTSWSKTKDYIFTSSDYGIGQVQNSVISTNNYEPATENENIFYKGYTFTGDVYGETFVPVYMKDGLENTNVEFVSVSNLDNTAPSIEEIILNKSLHNTEVVISANDINEKLKASGSGVTGYAISTENEIPDTFQELNTFNLTEAGKYYIFVTDLVGNITSKKIYIPVQYKVTINPDGGTWKGDTNPQEIDLNSDETINLHPEPEKKGYIFKEWDISGEGEITEDGDLIIEGDVTVIPIWETNKYSVTFIDYDVTHNRIINTTTREADFNSEISGSYIGNDKNDNVYYPQYRLISDTSVIISINPENNVVYRYFEFCYTSKESHINFNDDNNKDGLRPETYKLQLILEGGELIQEVTLPTTEPDYIFENLPKYDEQGEECIYKIIPIISDRYDVLPNPEDESTPEVTYNNPECSIKIPKITTLDGKNGNLTYTINAEANLFYKDKIIIVPDENITLTDGVKNMVATITQNKTEFNKDDIVENNLEIIGNIQTSRKHFAGVWKGVFNFKIKYEVKN